MKENSNFKLVTEFPPRLALDAIHYYPVMSVKLRCLHYLQCTLDCLECTVVAESAL